VLAQNEAALQQATDALFDFQTDSEEDQHD
jgi:hypothetical protein